MRIERFSQLDTAFHVVAAGNMHGFRYGLTGIALWPGQAGYLFDVCLGMGYSVSPYIANN
jgi:hypothetical protein